MTAPTFTDTAFVRQADLNSLPTGINNLSTLLAGVNAPRGYIPTATALITSTKPIPNRTDTVVTFDAAGVNNDVIWVPAQSAFVTKTGGVYVAWGQACWTANGTGTRSCSILLNGTTPAGNGVALTANKTPSGTDLATIGVQTPPIALSVGAAFYFNVWQSSGGSLTLATGLSGTYMAVMRLGNQT